MRTIFAVLVAVVAIDGFSQQFDRGQEPSMLPPAESARAFTVPDDLEIELLLSEPEIAQPLQITFDERGRMWVVEYRQYPEPAGLKQVSHDKFWRSVYDRVPSPPPNHFKGKDRISIHEDTDGDGTFDSHKVFVDGLNIVTSVALGRGGVWVLNPPYLLFYPDRDRDDIPDGNPDVHLSGFGLEDTHSVANSLRWGPDGWLYACQGSTVSGRVKIEPLPSDHSPIPTNSIDTLGQNIWRYHPGTRRYEVFAEGGGNAFGLEIDSHGRMFSGHNGGDTRGFHYVQGGYLQKGFQKHGELSNPYAYGYFPQMKNDRVERFTHTFLIYEADTLPDRYRNMLFGIEPLQGRVVLSELNSVGSTFETRDLEHVVTTTDRWFRPVDIKPGPDGAVYIADWHDFSINHWRNYNGNMDAKSGRVWRLKAKGAKPAPRFDLARMSDMELIEEFDHPGRWWRETASRLLIDRRNPDTLDPLAKSIVDSTERRAPESFWTLHATGGTEIDLATFLNHPNPQVRLWAVRFIGDPFPGTLDSGGNSEFDPAHWESLKRSARSDAPHLVALAESESNLEVRIQLAATAKRLPSELALPIIKSLAERDEDAGDPRQPLMLWWALETKATDHRNAVLELFTDAAFWERPIVKQHLLERVMRRYAQAGSGEDLLTCATLLNLSPSKSDSEILMRGFETAFRGRSVAGLPDELITAMARHEVGSVAIEIRRGDRDAMADALRIVASPEATEEERCRLIEVLGEVKSEDALPTLLKLARNGTNDVVLSAVFTALQAFDEPSVAHAALERIGDLSPTSQTKALTLMTSRPSFANALLRAVQEGRTDPEIVSREFARKLKSILDEGQLGEIDQLWPKAGRPSSAEMDREIARLSDALEEGHGDPYEGKRLFDTICTGCHQLFNQGGDIGPDLTSLDRRDVASLLLAIVNPNAEIREGYENFSISMNDERLLGGFIVEQDDRRVILRGFDGQSVVLSRADIDSITSAGNSLMPDGLTTTLDDQHARDLFAYLRSSQPLNE